ncbi:MAG: hypothetical protein ACAH27_05530 [Xanthobacteraceae bacterium]
MIILALCITLAIAVPVVWLLVEFSSRHRWLFLAIPLLLAAPIGLYSYGGTLLGYAVTAPLPATWKLISVAVDNEAKRVYVLVRTPGADGPRLYAVTDDFEDARKAAGRAQADMAKGFGVSGVIAPNGRIMMYALPPQAGSKG